MLTPTRIAPSPDVTPAMLAHRAVDALRQEALLSPKPGLVDRHGQGSHDDMTLEMLLRSSEALFSTFRELAATGTQDLSREQLRDRVGVIGRQGEAVMMDATEGVNTHRGALWSVGLLVTVAPSAASEGDLLCRAAELARTPDAAGPPPRDSHGQAARRAHGARGAVGEATAGFPNIAQVALPALRASRERGESEERARLRALIALIASVDDTCVLHRGGLHGLRWVQRGARRVQDARNFDPALRRFSDETDRRRLSPGGSADLLSAAIFVDSLGLPRTPTQEISHERL